MKQSYDTCSIEAIERLLENELTEDEQAVLESHLDGCDDCCDRLQNMTADAHQWADVAASLSSASGIFLNDTPAIGPGLALDFLQPTDDPHMLGRFAGYEIVGVIGSGGMGIVLKGFDRALNRNVAIKVLMPHYASSVAARQRFAREARAAAAVVHDNVVAIHSVSANAIDLSNDETWDGNRTRLPYLVMPYLRGESLQKRIDRCGALPVAEVLRISMQIALGLSAAHEQGLVHRDIKPANILLPEEVERVQITDFGLARAADDASLTRTGVIAGTPQYMSPEQARGDVVTSASDLFSLGSVMYAICTGRVPFRADTPLGVLRKIVDVSPRPIQEINPDIPIWLCQIVERLHKKCPGDRPHDANEVARLLKDCLAHVQQPAMVPLPKTIDAQTKSPLFNFDHFKRFKGVLTMFATIMAAGLGILLWQFGFPQDTKPMDRLDAQSAIANPVETQKPYEKEFLLAFGNPDEVGKLLVDIKRGHIHVIGHSRQDVIVKLSVPNYEPESKKSSDGLSTLRPKNLDFDIQGKQNQIKIDSNSNRYITNLEIWIPRETNLELDSYRDGTLQVTNVTGNLDVRSQNNNICLSQISGSTNVWSYNGSLEASFDSLASATPICFETYNGNVDVSLPSDVKVTTKFRTGTGKMLTNFDLQTQDGEFRIEKSGTGAFEISSDEFVSGEINGGGSLVKLETQKGDIRLRKRIQDQQLQSTQRPLKEMDTGVSVAVELESRMKIYSDVKLLVEKDQMPEYLLFASHAGLLEIRRESAIKELDFEQARKIEALLILDYEKAIGSYEAMMEDASWKKRFPDMDLEDIGPYQRRLKFLKESLSNGQAWNEKLGQQLGDEWNKKLGPKLGEEWNEKLGDRLGKEWNERLKGNEKTDK